MVNKRAKQKKPKQNQKQSAGTKGGATNFESMGSPSPAKKNKKKR